MKKRIDTILVEKQYFTSRQKAQFAIEEKIVFVNGNVIDKPSKLIAEEDEITIKGQALKYVSRGGLKLEKAIKNFQISLEGKICIDIGASTGGFTDCMLQNGAEKVYAIDVGHEQLDKTLQKNPKVINKEGTNIKDLTIEEMEKVDFISADVSFISLTQVLTKIYDLLKIKGRAVVLIKPQFEAGKIAINKNGVVKDSKVHKKIIQNIILLANKIGFAILGLDYSPIKGPAGNIEYLLYLEKNENNFMNSYEIKGKINEIVETASKNLK